MVHSDPLFVNVQRVIVRRMLIPCLAVKDNGTE